ncbi:hypothetical protein [Cognatilysobacter lacus]|uniref:Uncharacterized protein n=1 Tax=Cognatilysobacter lacus TaxID=1643323 RepID=A0A5D8Z649_9GAMM|nr:hypothetical protein [Lysobacter lacus]TZF90229.1 hypothetical protein FW784_06130 [Lysobacter lacus]
MDSLKRGRARIAESVDALRVGERPPPGSGRAQWVRNDQYPRACATAAHGSRRLVVLFVELDAEAVPHEFADDP